MVCAHQRCLAMRHHQAGFSRCRAIFGADTTFVERRVRIPSLLRTFPVDSLGLDTFYVYPDVSSTLRPGDLFEVSVKGTPGCRAFFDVEGVGWNLPMTERPPSSECIWQETLLGEERMDTTGIRGIYTGVYQIQAWDVADEARVTFHLVNGDADTVSVEAPGRLTVDSSPVPRVGVLTEETTVARPGPGLAYTWFLPRGVKLWLTGKRGAWHRVWLAEGQEAWVAEGTFEELPAGTPVPRGSVTVVRTVSLGDRVRVQIPLGERVPFHIRQRTTPSSLIVTLYGVWSDTDWIPYDCSDPLIQDIRWRQVSSAVYELEVFLNQEQQWGYDPRYDGTTLEIDVKRGPRIAGWPSSPFKNVTVCLDPGHHPDRGAVGPTGLEERTVNLAVALELKRMLEAKGAVVVMTREEREGIALRARPKLAAAVDADILVSIHHNAPRDWENPYKHNGSSTYYYHPMSSRLARLIHEEVLEEVRLPDLGVWYADLALCRPTQTVAVLTEEAFMTIPEQEMSLSDPAFRKRCARAIYRGLERFLKENR